MKYIRLGCALVGVLLVASVASAISPWNAKGEKLYDSIMGLAAKIVAHNKPTSGPTKGEDVWGGTQWAKEWKKNGTHVAALSGKRNGKYYTYHIETTDPMMSFSGGVRVGLSIRELENYLGLALRQIDPENDGTIDIYASEDGEGGGFGPHVQIKYRNNKIVSIMADDLHP